ncbi:MAG TPA: hypothetical protein VNU24_06920 [Solirubrobacteraceae bacterium]|jgi:hypothetical protein|nr:hypothetical protein [Solirubrobacteraceae bacterium]
MRRNIGTVSALLAISLCVPTLVVVGAAGPAARASAARSDPTGHEARVIDLMESAHLAFVSEDGAALVERGHATGTYIAPVTATFTIHPKDVNASVTVYPHGGSITGVAHANYIVQNNVGYFGGTFVITHGTGSFAHASGNALGMSGTIDRYNFATTVKAHGKLSL